MADYEDLNKNDLLKINDYMSSVKLDLLTLNVDIDYSLSPQKNFTTRIHADIRIPSLQESKFLTLFPPAHSIDYISFTRKDDFYRVGQEFKLGSMYNNKEFLERVLEIEEGDEWIIKKYKEEGVIISFEEAMDISRKLMMKLTNRHFKEVDERLISEKWVRYHPLPSLAHRFGILQYLDMYTGSEINLEDEIVKDLNESSLKNNLIKFHQFFQNLS